MQRDKLTADPKYFTTCQDSILIVHFDASFNQYQHGNKPICLKCSYDHFGIL